MHLLFLFFDGIGLGADNPEINPFARAKMPVLERLLDSRKLIQASVPYENQRASLLALDACLGVDGMPQSATGQAVLLTGRNIPAELGYHYGPKPNAEVAAALNNGNIFSAVEAAKKSAVFINAYPPRYFDGIQSGRRNYSSIPMAAAKAGVGLKTAADLKAGGAIAADFTAAGWHEHLGLLDVPIITPWQAGARLAELSRQHDFTLFEYWLSDYAGHNQDMEAACELLATIDSVFGGLLDAWDFQQGLILLTSDHGNLEDLSTRRHTMNKVPALLIGSQSARQEFSASLTDIAGINPAILRFLEIDQVPPEA